MKHSLNDEERKMLNGRIAEAEKHTGVQIVLAVVERSDIYAELPWKAFALGASVAGLLIFIMNLLWPLTSPVAAALLAIVMMLSAGAGFALLSVFVPDFARLFLSLQRAHVETRQYAESIFLSRQLFATRERKAVLLLVSLFERCVIILPDMGLTRQLNQETTDMVIKHMRIYLKAGQTARALEAGLKKLEECISGDEQSASPDNELPDEIIEERGA
jgi:putative membrane protein